MKKKPDEKQIIVHAWKNPKFKQDLLNNPKKALKEFGCEFPDHIQVHVIEQKPNTFVLVLPPAPVHVEDLSEEELKGISGGIY